MTLSGAQLTGDFFLFSLLRLDMIAPTASGSMMPSKP
jgi:hypothetical protein